MTSVATVAAVAVTESEVSWTKAAVSVMFRDVAIANGASGVVGDAGDMTALCIGIKDDFSPKTVTAATTHMYTRVTGRKTAG